MPAIGPREVTAAVRTLTRGQLARYGGSGTSETGAFEAELAATTGAARALALNSGTSALIAALVGVGVGPGDEVLVPAYTWVSTAAAALAVGAVPVLVDIDESLTMDPADLARKVSPRSRAVIPVHMLNLVADLDAIGDVAAAHDLAVIEDACQAVGVTHRGRRCGSIGVAGAFSFNQHKNIKAGEGGALLTSDARVRHRAGMYHDVGSYERPSWAEVDDEPLFAGVNFRMSELTSAVLRPQWARIDRIMARRAARRAVALDVVASVPGLRVSPHHDEAAAVGLAVVFDDPGRAAEFARARGVNRLADTGRHIYTNWRSLASKRTHHPGIDPWRWAYGDECRPDPVTGADCPRVLDILERTCSVSLDPDVPMPVFTALARRMGRGRPA